MKTTRPSSLAQEIAIDRVRMDAAVKRIAREELLIDTLDAQRSGADFHEVAVWQVRKALQAAYEAGRRNSM